MLEYPKNRTYTITPIRIFEKYFPEFLDVARKTLDEKFVVWDFPNNAKILKTLNKEIEIKFHTHDKILLKVNSEKWSRPENFKPSAIKPKINVDKI